MFKATMKCFPYLALLIWSANGNMEFSVHTGPEKFRMLRKGTEDEKNDGPDDGALEVISDAVSNYWSVTKELFKDLWSRITG